MTVFHFIFIKLVIKGKSVANTIFEKSLQGVRWKLLGPHSLWVPEGDPEAAAGLSIALKPSRDMRVQTLEP